MAQRALTVSLASRAAAFTPRPRHDAPGGHRGDVGHPVGQAGAAGCNEYLDGLLPLLAGEPADATGETVTTRGALIDSRRADAPTCTSRRLARRLLRIAGRRTAGTLHVDDRTEDAGRARRPDAAPGGGRRGPARERGRGSRRRCRSASPTTSTVRASRPPSSSRCTATLPSYRAMLDREGYAGPEDAAIIGDEATVKDAPRRAARGGRRRVRRRDLRRLAREAVPAPARVLRQLDG